jgi:SAM-dependent methyltransferase
MTTDPAELSEFSIAQAKVRTSYDDVPYASYPYAQSHPNRVAATATLLGLTPQAIETASVLEIGCAAGGNLIPMAAAYPQARFLGIDLSSKQIDQARVRAKRLGLDNIEFRHQDVTSFEKSDRGHDYIICHGVYSWVSDPVRNAILNLCAANLTPDGVAYISYNVLPGWRPRQVVRDAMLAHVSDIADPAQRLSQARAFIDFLKDSAPKSPYGEAIREVASWLGSMGGSYVFHEFLEIDNAPCTFKDFMKAANRHGLVFLGECELRSMLPENYGAVAPTIRTLGGNDVVAAEQYIDVFSGRTFRQTLLVPAARLPGISRNVSPDRLASLHLVSNLAAVPSDDPDFPYVFKDPVGATFKTRRENVRRTFELIQANQPGSSSYRQLLDQLNAGGGPLTPADEAEVLNSLQTALMIGLLTASATDRNGQECRRAADRPGGGPQRCPAWHVDRQPPARARRVRCRRPASSALARRHQRRRSPRGFLEPGGEERHDRFRAGRAARDRRSGAQDLRRRACGACPATARRAGGSLAPTGARNGSITRHGSLAGFRVAGMIEAEALVRLTLSLLSSRRTLRKSRSGRREPS